MEREVVGEDSLSGHFQYPAIFLLQPDLAFSLWMDLAATVDDMTWSVKLSRVEN